MKFVVWLTDVFKKFINKEGKLKESVTKDTWGMLSLYEASYLATGDEYILLQAMELTRTQLIHQSMLLAYPKSSRHIAQALALPRHLRMQRTEAGNYTNEYSREWNQKKSLVQLAKLDFNMVQSLHQIELTEIKKSALQQ